MNIHKSYLVHDPYWRKIGKQFYQNRLGRAAFFVVVFFCLVGVYAPFLASSKPLVVQYDGDWYFPLFRYLFYNGFFTKKLDIFFNLLIFILPLTLLAWITLRRFPKLLKSACLLLAFLQFGLFLYLINFPLKDPASDSALSATRHSIMKTKFASTLPSWEDELEYMSPYAKLNMVLRYQQRVQQDQRLEKYHHLFAADARRRWLEDAVRTKKAQILREGKTLPSDEVIEAQIFREQPGKLQDSAFPLPTLLQLQRSNETAEIARQKERLKTSQDSLVKQRATAKIAYLEDKHTWLEENVQKLHFEAMPLIRNFHWEEDAGGDQSMNQYISWWDLTRTNRKDLVSALIFGVRISLVVGLTSVTLALLIGIPVGAFAGYYGGFWDILVSRLLEIWEAMPVFLMLLIVVAITQSKSIFLVITVIGIFGWTSFSRFIRGEFFKQRNLSYVEACHASGFKDSYIMFSHILPNAIPPLLTLLPFAIMAAITSEAALSFLGLGEEGSCSWGVLMDEGRNAFPAESYLLWPPATLLTILLVAIALVGDALRDALDPKMHS